MVLFVLNSSVYAQSNKKCTSINLLYKKVDNDKESYFVNNRLEELSDTKHIYLYTSKHTNIHIRVYLDSDLVYNDIATTDNMNKEILKLDRSKEYFFKIESLKLNYCYEQLLDLSSLKEEIKYLYIDNAPNVYSCSIIQTEYALFSW